MKEKRDHIWRKLDNETKCTYGREYLEKTYENFESSFPRYPNDLSPVVRALRSGLLSKRPRQHYSVGPGVGTLLTFYPLLPVWIADMFSIELGFPVKDVLPNALKRQS